MRWERWDGWTAGDPRWRVHVIDTSTTPRRAAARMLAEWIERERALLEAGAHPLADGSWANSSDG